MEKYLQDYAARLSKDIFRFNTQVTRVEYISQPDRTPWKLFLRKGGEEASEEFDFVIVASGFFARPWIPQPFIPFTTRSDSKTDRHGVFHSSEYTFDRVISSFRSDANRIPKVVVIGGSLSAVEIISDICINVNSTRSQASAQRSPATKNEWEVIQISPRPFWILPRFLPHQRKAQAGPSPPKFLPLDLILYDVSNRRDFHPGSSDVAPSEAERHYQINTGIRTLLGYISHAQADISPNLEITEENGWMSSSPWVTISDTYANFVREKKAEMVIGRVSGAGASKDGRINLTLTPNSSVETIADVDAIICCTGYVPCLDEFLSPEILRAMDYTTASPSNPDVTFLPAILPQQIFLTGLPRLATTTLGFVGMYKGPYFGVVELQARYLAALFAGELEWPKQETLSQEAEAMKSMRRSREITQLSEGGTKERKQCSWGDYMAVMKYLAEELGISAETPFSTHDSSASSSKGEIDPIIPAHFPPQNSKQNALKSLQALTEALDSSFLSIAVFRALHGSWKVHRKIVSHLPDVSGGIFEGTANFLPRRDERNSPYSSSNGTDCAISDAYDYEYLYSESGTFTLSNNPEMKLEAKKSYIYRYEEERQVVSVWFVKGGQAWTADNLFHEISDFDGVAPTISSRSASARASGSRHLCGPDTYNTSYLFSFLNSGPDLERFTIKYQVEGPRKNYVSEATYERAGL